MNKPIYLLIDPRGKAALIAHSSKANADQRCASLNTLLQETMGLKGTYWHVFRCELSDEVSGKCAGQQ